MNEEDFFKRTLNKDKKKKEKASMGEVCQDKRRYANVGLMKPMR